MAAAIWRRLPPKRQIWSTQFPRRWLCDAQRLQLYLYLDMGRMDDMGDKFSSFCLWMYTHVWISRAGGMRIFECRRWYAFTFIWFFIISNTYYVMWNIRMYILRTHYLLMCYGYLLKTWSGKYATSQINKNTFYIRKILSNTLFDLYTPPYTWYLTLHCML